MAAAVALGGFAGDARAQNFGGMIKDEIAETTEDILDDYGDSIVDGIRDRREARRDAREDERDRRQQEIEDRREAQVNFIEGRQEALRDLRVAFASTCTEVSVDAAEALEEGGTMEAFLRSADYRQAAGGLRETVAENTEFLSGAEASQLNARITRNLPGCATDGQYTGG